MINRDHDLPITKQARALRISRGNTVSKRFSTRVKMIQVGARDEAKLLGGVGVCGLTLCCSTWLTDFRPISIQMAKRQSLSLNPSKISGQCGRLLCCLAYEDDNYKSGKGPKEPGPAKQTDNRLTIVRSA